MRDRSGRLNVDERARSPSDSCRHLVLVLLKVSFGILISLEYISHTWDLNPIN